MAFDYFYGFPQHVTAGERRRTAARELARLAKSGQTITPVVIDGRRITTTFWGDAWCRNLEHYSDYANRLPRGRSYVRHGCVVDLQITAGRVAARVSGSDLYEVNIDVAAVPAATWRAIRRDSAGEIGSVIELLQGRLSTHVMARLCQKGTGLFPSPAEIRLSCSCPDSARMCKHVAAVLYGIGARLDHAPELLFTLRQVNQQDLIAGAGAAADLTKAGSSSSRRIVDEELLGDVFGIDLAPRSEARAKGQRPKALTTRPQVQAPRPKAKGRKSRPTAKGRR